jgi:indole-3-acetate monooxygenase
MFVEDAAVNEARRTAAQHIVVVPSNYEMVGQALLGLDVRATPLLAMDDRSDP